MEEIKRTEKAEGQRFFWRDLGATTVPDKKKEDKEEEPEN